MNVSFKIPTYLSSMAVMHLNWMEDHDPQRIEKLYEDKKLKEYLSEKVNSAKYSMEELVQKGKTGIEAREEVVHQIICQKADRDRPPVAPMPGQMRETIRMSLFE